LNDNSVNNLHSEYHGVTTNQISVNEPNNDPYREFLLQKIDSEKSSNNSQYRKKTKHNKHKSQIPKTESNIYQNIELKLEQSKEGLA
jgi:adenosylmethionine-8-amino-7-oxononanoate aminotransferase